MNKWAVGTFGVCVLLMAISAVIQANVNPCVQEPKPQAPRIAVVSINWLKNSPIDELGKLKPTDFEVSRALHIYAMENNIDVVVDHTEALYVSTAVEISDEVQDIIREWHAFETSKP